MSDAKQQIINVIRGINNSASKTQDKEIVGQLSDDESPKKMRRIVIETDGNYIDIVEDESAGVIELKAILSSTITYLNNYRGTNRQ